MRHKAAGGIRSKNVTHKPVRTGVGARAVNVKWPAQVGLSRGNRVQNSLEGGGGKVLQGVRAEPYKGQSFKPVPLGNSLVNNVGAGSPGAGRTLYGQSGSQQQYGKANPGNPAPKGELFPGWPAKR
jgi:hypothetical protein